MSSRNANVNANANGTGGRVTSIAILIGSASGKSGNKGGGLDATTVPLVVWTLRERGASELKESRSTPDHSVASTWTRDLVYYEFLDDTARWTHLDQLLLQLCDDNDDGVGDDDGSDGSSPLPSIHLGSSENLEKGNKKPTTSRNRNQSQSTQSTQSTQSKSKSRSANPTVARAQKLLRSLQLFIDDRLFSNTSGKSNSNSNSNSNTNSNTNTNTHVYPSVPVDASQVEASLSQLLEDDEKSRLAVRGDIKLSEPPIRQGLALWLQSQGLYGSGGCNNSNATTFYDHSLRVRPGHLNSCLTMDTTAARAIHLLPPTNDGEAVVIGGSRNTNSLWGLLSEPCVTAVGKKQLRVWLRQPLVDLVSIQQRQTAVESLLGMAKDSIRDGLRPFGGGKSNLSRLGPTLAKYRQDDHSDDEDNDDDDDVDNGATIGRIVDTKKPLEALYHLYVLASNHLPHLLDCMECIAPDGNGGDGNGNGNENENENSPILNNLYQQVSDLEIQLRKCTKLVEVVLDLDQAPEEFLVRAEYDEALQELHRDLEIVQESVRDEHENIQEAWNDVSSSGGKASQVRLERVDDNTSWQFRLPDTNDAKNVESVGQKIKVHRILKNGVYFSSPELRQLSAKYQDLQSEYAKWSRKFVRDAMAIASTYSFCVDRVAETVGTLDVFCALAYTAAMSPHGYCKPTMTDSDEDGAGIRLMGARHPCVELQENMEYIPNDIHLAFPEQAQLLVSGPNMGGKSVYIRSLGAIVCMAQIGSYVPCTSATINICHAILARVGAGDLQERGISTFMAEMLESSAILRAATKRSLIIVDELGRGTSTFDGYGLARAILEYLRDRVGCMVVFATHFHELTHLPRVRNCHVTAQKGSQGLTFLYQVRPGPCLESFGIQVAEMAHVPRAVIEDAKKRARKLENFNNNSAVDAGGATDGTATGAANKKPKTKLSENQTILQKFARLDLPALLNRISTLGPEEKQDEIRKLILPNP